MKPATGKSRWISASLCCALAALLAGTNALAQDKAAQGKAGSRSAGKTATATPASAPGAKCNNSTFATTDRLGELMLFRDVIPVRKLTDASAWITQCEVSLNMGSPSVPSKCSKSTPLLKDKRLFLRKTVDGLVMELRNPNGKVERSGPVTLGGTDPAGTVATWLTMTWKPGTDDEEHYFVMMPDYAGTGLPNLKSIAKYYLVEAFDSADWKNPDCRSEAPDNQNNFKKYSGKAPMDVNRPKQTDTGSGVEPGRNG